MKIVDLPAEEQGFFRAALAFIDDYAVEFLAVEVIVLIPDLNLAGTVDWIGKVGGRMVIGDWKTRAKRHAAYPEEAAQLGSYSLADKMVVGDFPGTLMDMPPIEGLMVVSLKDDGSYAAYPIDLEQARNTAEHMARSFYGAQDLAAEGTRAISEPLKGQADAPEETYPEALLDLRRSWLRARVQALSSEAKDTAARLWPNKIPMKADVLTHDEIDSVSQALDTTEAEHGVPFFDPDPAAPPPEPGSGKAKPQTTQRRK